MQTDNNKYPFFILLKKNIYFIEMFFKMNI